MRYMFWRACASESGGRWPARNRAWRPIGSHAWALEWAWSWIRPHGHKSETNSWQNSVGHTVWQTFNPDVRSYIPLNLDASISRLTARIWVGITMITSALPKHPQWLDKRIRIAIRVSHVTQHLPKWEPRKRIDWSFAYNWYGILWSILRNVQVLVCSKQNTKIMSCVILRCDSAPFHSAKAQWSSLRIRMIWIR